MSAPVLIIGASGRLGTALVKVLQAKQQVYLAPSSQELNVTDFEKIRAYVEGNVPSAIVYLAGYTNVDGGEINDQLSAYALNAQVPETLAILCAKHKLPLIFLSSDYVFSGSQRGYIEDDIPNPLNVYGISKAEGERRCLLRCPEQIYVVRTSRLFGPSASSANAKKSFLELILADATKDPVVYVNPEEYGVPTFVPDLAEYLATHFLGEKRPKPGIYHASNTGTAVTWLEWAQSLVEMSKLPVEIRARNVLGLIRAAKRPPHLQLVSKKLPPMRPWREAQQEFLATNPYFFSPLWQP